MDEVLPHTRVRGGHDGPWWPIDSWLADQPETVTCAQIAGASGLSTECGVWAADLVVAEQVSLPALDPLPPVLVWELDVEPVG
jgi:hypothetical protein